MIGLFTCGATASLMPKNETKKLSQLFEELQGSNLEFKLITPKPITWTYFLSNMSRFGLAGFPMVAILNFFIGYILAGYAGRSPSDNSPCATM